MTRLDRLLGDLGRYVGALRELGAIPREVFLSNSDKIGNAKYHFVIAIECCVDIANHIIASEGFRFPKDNADSSAVLIGEGIIGADQRDRLRAMAQFRNRLIHLYGEIDDARVCDFLQDSLGDLERFARDVASHDW